MTATIDGAAIDSVALASGVPVPPGTHDIALSGTMKGERWALLPQWNGAALWQSTVRDDGARRVESISRCGRGRAGSRRC